MADQLPSRRNSMRLAGYDYTAAGAYFVTICAYRGQSLFGQIVEGVPVLSALGEITLACWQAIPAHYPQVALDESIIMPNHLHGVLWILNEQNGVDENIGMDGSTGTIYSARTAERARTGDSPAYSESEDRERRFGSTVPGSLSSIVGKYKAAVTREARKAGLFGDGKLWHRNFWDHIVRDEHSLAQIRHYIRTNPARWGTDQLHPDAAPNRWNQAWQGE